MEYILQALLINMIKFCKSNIIENTFVCHSKTELLVHATEKPNERLKHFGEVRRVCFREMNSIILRSGARMPLIGFGTFTGSKNTQDAYQAELENKIVIYNSIVIINEIRMKNS